MEKSVAHRCHAIHCPATLLSKQNLSYNIFGASRFFLWGHRHLIFRECGKQRRPKLSEERWRLSNRNPPPKADRPRKILRPTIQLFNLIGLGLRVGQGSKLGWSCGPSLPKVLSDHQIVLCGGPVVYWKTHQYFNF